MTTTIGEPDKIRASPVTWLAAMAPTTASRDDPHGWYQHALAVDSGSGAKHVIRLAVAQLSASERDETQTLTPDPPIAIDADADAVAAMTWSVMAKLDQGVVTHTGILYRVIQVGDLRVPVGGLSGVMTLPDWRGRGYARAVVASAAAFVGVWLWAPFAVVLCSLECTAFYESLGWRKANAPISCEQPGGRQELVNRVAMVLPCQGE